jgi:LmbE family N-acetylglucosaminyl deacetylase
VVVFAAHPDDEALGAGGLIHAAVLAGARVRVVFFTNGDGYLTGVDVGFRTLLSTPGRFIEYGQRRQREAVAAAGRVGLSANDLIFLGYPDRGLAVLWGPGWGCDRPYTSPYTRRNHAPYPLSYRPGIAYCGQHVLEDVESVLGREQPTVIVSHHPADTHRDHWAAGAFVMAALEHLRAADIAWTKTARVWPYLVHHGGWPLPRGYAPEEVLTPPADLLRAMGGWTEYPLDPVDQDAKRTAILEYRTQTQLQRSYMLSFVRRNELFDGYRPIRPSALEGSGLPVAASERWDRLPSVIRGGGPAGSLVRAAEGSATVDTVGLARDSAHLYIAVRLRRAAIREAQYRVVAMLFYPDGRTARLRLLFQAPRSLTATQSQVRDLPLPSGATARSFERRINIVVPLAGIGRPASLLMYVDTRGPLRMPVDRSPWAVVHLDPTGGEGQAHQTLPADETAKAPRRTLESEGTPAGLVQ